MMSGIKLARRAIACKHWRWMRGMHVLGGGIVVDADDRDLVMTCERCVRGPFPDDTLPNLGNPATIGCLLELVREAWDDKGLSADGQWSGRHGWLWSITGGKHHGSTFRAMMEHRFETEAEALVSALEAAP